MIGFPASRSLAGRHVYGAAAQDGVERSLCERRPICLDLLLILIGECFFAFGQDASSVSLSDSLSFPRAAVQATRSPCSPPWRGRWGGDPYERPGATVPRRSKNTKSGRRAAIMVRRKALSPALSRALPNKWVLLFSPQKTSQPPTAADL